MQYIIQLICGFILVASITACQSINVTESHFLNPDKAITQSLLDKSGRQLQLSQIHIKASDGIQLGGVLITQKNAKFTLIYFGGNEFRINTNGADVATTLSQFDNNLLIVDHRGYGMSQGSPNIETLKQDAESVYDFVKSQPELSQLPIIVHGLSLGSMIAGNLSNQRPLDGLVLEGSLTTVKDMIDKQIPWYATPFIDFQLNDKLANINNLVCVANYTEPLLVIVGENDNTTPKALSEALFAQSKSTNKQLYIVPNKGHGNAMLSPDFSKHYQAFIHSILYKQAK
ncbi:lysophospholipase [Shewanella profunda]|uniref:alpha/beta hydrolase n=1 Tax=Shewanella profunda TaxID=254793 RepID=UPI00200CB44D|nr:alpha/beta hydrolase [Shewanella profunda]MCL1088395.1 lysophospholipase [Shewanella profunda]